MRRSSSKRSRMPSLTTSLRWMTPRAHAVLGDDQRRAAGGGDAVDELVELAAAARGPPSARSRRTASAAPLRIERPSMSTPLMRVCAVKGMSVAPESSRSRRLKRSLARTTIERPSGVSSARLESCAASASSRSVDARQRQELGRLAVAERDGAGLVEQQRGAVAGRLDGPAGPREHVVLHQAVHAGDADRREQRADRRGDEAHEQRREHDHVLARAGVHGERLQGGHGDRGRRS